MVPCIRDTMLLAKYLLIIGVVASEKKCEDCMKGHLEPLGSHRPPHPDGIDTFDDFPHPKKFFHEYVVGNKPMLIKQAAKRMPAFHLWDDPYLIRKFANQPLHVETGKKEDRKNDVHYIPMRDFIKDYVEKEIYMVQDLYSDELKIDDVLSDVVVPASLRCGNFEKSLHNIIMWFSSGGTNSVLHTDSLDNINCILSGTKQLFLVDQKHGVHLKFDKPGAHSGVDVEKVDFVKYPELKDVPWFNVTMETGDCLFIPYLWAHNVKSSNTRNLATNFWISHLSFFNESSCDYHDFEKPFMANEMDLTNVGYSFMHELYNGMKDVESMDYKSFLLLLRGALKESMDESSNEEDLIDILKDSPYKLFKVLDLNSDGKIDKHEIVNGSAKKIKSFLHDDHFGAGYEKDEL